MTANADITLLIPRYDAVQRQDEYTAVTVRGCLLYTSKSETWAKSPCAVRSFGLPKKMQPWLFSLENNILGSAKKLPATTSETMVFWTPCKKRPRICGQKAVSYTNLVLVARCDGQPIVWPVRTHAPRDSEDVRTGRLLPWRSAAEIIDWSVPCYSVFASKRELKEKYGVNAVRPLAANTMRRIIRGVDKFTIRSGQPFIVECNHGGDGHVREDTEPLSTITGKHSSGICNPIL